jgi:hypothetical protein
MQYPDAFCLKCQLKTPTSNKRTVVLKNASRALTGNCGKCGYSVYQILAPKSPPPAPKSNIVSIHEHRAFEQHSASAPRPLTQENKIDGLSFLGGMFAGVVIMLVTIIGHGFFT